MKCAGVAQLVEQLICNQQVAGSSPITSSIYKEEFPSGQRGQTVNLLRLASVVRIHPPPPKIRTRIADRGWKYIACLKEAYEQKDKTAFLIYKEKFLDLFDVQEALMATNRHTLLGSWLQKAEQYADNEEERKLYTYNAKNLITLWASKKGSVELRDYAHREWAGMIRDFYKVRWQTYLNQLDFWFESREEMPEVEWVELDYAFMLTAEGYTAQEQGDLKKAVDRAVNILEE